MNLASKLLSMQIWLKVTAAFVLKIFTYRFYLPYRLLFLDGNSTEYIVMLTIKNTFKITYIFWTGFTMNEWCYRREGFEAAFNF